jgi:hypothetical protein
MKDCLMRSCSPKYRRLKGLRHRRTVTKQFVDRGHPDAKCVDGVGDGGEDVTVTLVGEPWTVQCKDQKRYNELADWVVDRRIGAFKLRGKRYYIIAEDAWFEHLDLVKKRDAA